MADRSRLTMPLHTKVLLLGFDVANGRHPLSKAIPPLLLLLDALLCVVIILKIPYTEIDWAAYMEQVSQFIAGERDYTKIRGQTGPLVYPAAHVYIFAGLYELTGEGRDIFLAQTLFAILYTLTQGLVMACYWEARAPPYIYPLLILSKRLHSIFVLRLFNDCFAVFFLFLAILCLQRHAWTLGALSFSLGLGVKMSLLLALPAVGAVLFLGRGLGASLRLLALIAQVQVLLALPFVFGEGSNWWKYLSRAFELSRVFLFKWTVNWRFVGEQIFSSKKFALALLAGHALVLGMFALRRWLKPAGVPVAEIVARVLFGKAPLTLAEEQSMSRWMTPRYVLTTVLSAMVVGMLFARSLHYQFYAYLAWSTPFLLWRSGLHPLMQYALWAAQEWAWNVYPSTPLSSGVVFGVLAATVGLLFVEDGEEWGRRNPRSHTFKDEAAKR